MKNHRVILRLLFTFFLFFFSALLLNLSGWDGIVSFLFEYHLKVLDFSNFIRMMYTIDYFSISFFFMVSSVSFMVLMFGEFYMIHYDLKKFFFILLAFVTSIILLSFSNSFLSFSLGWDALGLSSVFLIMFYPNKTTSYNSFLTFFFNRISDVFLLVCFSLFLVGTFMRIFQNSIITLVIWRLLLCSLIKRAQFPFSSWLPAAMSAPTPVSSLVHSSTLVTAGVLIIFKIWYIFKILIILELLIPIFLSGVFMGGLMANLEVDLKKTVAFSTMRQIGVVLILRIILSYLGLVHMLFHAYFKSFIFVISGFIFLGCFGRQMKNLFNFNLSYKIIFFNLIVSLFIMTGFFFSRSFWTKDLFIEHSFRQSSVFFFLFFLISRILTIMYCSKILSTVKSSFNMFKRSNFFSTPRILNLTGLYFIFICPFLGARCLLKNIDTFITLEEISLVRVILLRSTFLSFNIRNNYFLFINMEIFLMKSFTFSGFKFFNYMNILFSDSYLNEIKLFKIITIPIFIKKPLSSALYPFTGILLFLKYSLSLIRTWHWSCQSFRIIL